MFEYFFAQLTFAHACAFADNDVRKCTKMERDVVFAPFDISTEYALQCLHWVAASRLPAEKHHEWLESRDGETRADMIVYICTKVGAKARPSAKRA